MLQRLAIFIFITLNASLTNAQTKKELITVLQFRLDSLSKVTLKSEDYNKTELNALQQENKSLQKKAENFDKQLAILDKKITRDSTYFAGKIQNFSDNISKVESNLSNLTQQFNDFQQGYTSDTLALGETIRIMNSDFIQLKEVVLEIGKAPKSTNSTLNANNKTPTKENHDKSSRVFDHSQGLYEAWDLFQDPIEIERKGVVSLSTDNKNFALLDYVPSDRMEIKKDGKDIKVVWGPATIYTDFGPSDESNYSDIKVTIKSGDKSIDFEAFAKEQLGLSGFDLIVNNKWGRIFLRGYDSSYRKYNAPVDPILIELLKTATLVSVDYRNYKYFVRTENFTSTLSKL